MFNLLMAMMWTDLHVHQAIAVVSPAPAKTGTVDDSPALAKTQTVDSPAPARTRKVDSDLNTQDLCNPDVHMA